MISHKINPVAALQTMFRSKTLRAESSDSEAVLYSLQITKIQPQITLEALHSDRTSHLDFDSLTRHDQWRPPMQVPQEVWTRPMSPRLAAISCQSKHPLTGWIPMQTSWLPWGKSSKTESQPWTIPKLWMQRGQALSPASKTWIPLSQLWTRVSKLSGQLSARTQPIQRKMHSCPVPWLVEPAVHLDCRALPVQSSSQVTIKRWAKMDSPKVRIKRCRHAWAKQMFPLPIKISTRSWVKWRQNWLLLRRINEI